MSIELYDFKKDRPNYERRYSIQDIKKTSNCNGNEIEVESLGEQIEKHEKYIEILRRYGEMISNVTEEKFTLLFLTTCGIVISIIDFKETNKEDMRRFKLGMSFKEEAIGKNAVVMAMNLNTPIRLAPEEHNSSTLNNVHEYCVPLNITGNKIGYFNFITDQKSNIDRIVDIAHVIKFYTYYTIINSLNIYDASQQESPMFTRRQLEVLIKMAKGMTEYTISKELGVSIDTIRFHKKVIFKKLDVNCTVEAVIKGLKGNYISLNDT
ncbi:helix-turn-helix transcriptional regulator [Alkaliphilus peptidifermentans]|uniref:Regulatory protein, luxR family n=1 Tax=Alkaliphilus peptidifermentans DSM 18978 TaxID=1120976 RepID=A0A1G5I2B7_9FIRM|nr:LuxR C-terminal-related transcriptional regulator [Alkaliphilus peptidifermentans]SCY70182.1 regulatory protein, luxR family [Alkaliphilus peptidifermentans DSM 18978]